MADVLTKEQKRRIEENGVIHKRPLNQIKILRKEQLETPPAETAKWHLQHKPYGTK